MDALRPYKEGWLWKKGAKRKNWQRRWFVLCVDRPPDYPARLSRPPARRAWTAPRKNKFAPNTERNQPNTLFLNYKDRVAASRLR